MPDPFRSEDEGQRGAREASARAEQLAREAAAPLSRELRSAEDETARARRVVRDLDDVVRRKTFTDALLGPKGQLAEVVVIWLWPWLAAGAIVFGYLNGPMVWLMVLGAVGLLVIPARIVLVRQLAARELRWLGGLPFAVHGYAETLGTRMVSNGQVSVSIRLADESAMPDDAFCTRVFGSVADAVRLEPGKGTRYSTHNVRRWLRTLLGGMLVPFHDAFPIREIEIAKV